MFGSHYFGQPYVGQGYAGETGVVVEFADVLVTSLGVAAGVRGLGLTPAARRSLSGSAGARAMSLAAGRRTLGADGTLRALDEGTI